MNFHEGLKHVYFHGQGRDKEKILPKDFKCSDLSIVWVREKLFCPPILTFTVTQVSICNIILCHKYIRYIFQSHPMIFTLTKDSFKIRGTMHERDHVKFSTLQPRRESRIFWNILVYHKEIFQKTTTAMPLPPKQLFFAYSRSTFLNHFKKIPLLFSDNFNIF